MAAFPDWFWPTLSLVLAILWLWTLLRRRTAPGAPTSASELAYRSAKVEDVLKAAYVLGEAGETWDGVEVARSVGLPETQAEEVVRALVASGWARRDAQGTLHLTAAGEARARELIRAHRLWECYLVDREKMPVEAVHAEADRREHDMTPEELETLDAGLGHPAWDPHGHVIPAPGYQVPSTVARPLLEEGIPGSRLRVANLDDEPAPLLAQLMVMGLRPGVDVEVLEQQRGRMTLRVDEHIVPVAAAAARHVFVVPAPILPVFLGELPVGSEARVVEIRGGGKHERRMLDMGFVPGAGVSVIRMAPLGDPIEYRIKGTAVALRRDDANTVLVEEAHGD